MPGHHKKSETRAVHRVSQGHPLTLESAFRRSRLPDEREGATAFRYADWSAYNLIKYESYRGGQGGHFQFGTFVKFRKAFAEAIGDVGVHH